MVGKGERVVSKLYNLSRSIGEPICSWWNKILHFQVYKLTFVQKPEPKHSY